ncbi:collagen alpha-1(XII) chain-like [Saccostrea echinata]|uniref:collagen alpha-1(XII) chain-like n=1 Tax=Saccostrea echinata TaxID=191078 RepID=UPI002A83390A|nr:collagen alpha-1(XII) chain-like [Saccostrea echinata]
MTPYPLILLSILTTSDAQEMCSKKADIAFVIDSSRSIWKPNFDTQVKFLYDILKMFEISPAKTQVAAVSFSNVTSPEFLFNSFSSKMEVLEAIKDIKYTKGSATRTYTALEYMNEEIFNSENGARNDAVKIAIVMTDGETNPGGHDNDLSLEDAINWTQDEAKVAKDNGVNVFAIGIGSRINEKEIMGIASEPKAEFAIKVKTYEEFKTDKLKELVAYRACSVGKLTTEKPLEPLQEQCFRLVADVIFAIDQSTSIESEKNFSLELDFVVKVVKNFDVGLDETRVGAVVFSDEADRVLELKDEMSKGDVIRRIHDIKWGRGNTFMDKAFVKMREGFSKENGGRPKQVPQIAVLVTDGVATDPYRALAEANKLKSEGVEIFTIGVKSARLSQLNELSSDPDSQHVFSVDSLEALSSIVSRLSSRVCSSIQEKHRRRTLQCLDCWILTMWTKTVLALSFVVGALCDHFCSKEADIAFVIDSSNSIWPPNFDTQVHFLYDVLSLFDISPTKTQIAAVSYSDIIKPEFQFNTHKDKDGVLGATQNIEQTEGGATRTYKALEYMNDEIFTSKNGARSDVMKIAIIMTDGETNPGSVDSYSQHDAKQLTLMEAKRARDNGIYVFAIGVGGKVVDEELYGMASEPDSVIKVPTYGEFKTDKLKDMLAKKTCDVGETTTVKPNKPEEECFKHVADVIFAIDQSTSIGSPKNFSIELDFVNDLVEKFDIAEDETRVGAVVFSTGASRFLELRDGVDKTLVLNRIHGRNWERGNTNMHLAFQKMQEGFLPAKGGRPRLVPQIAVMVTDGEATNPFKARDEAAKLRKSGVLIFAIGVMGANRTELETYASSPDNVYYVNNLQALRSISSELSTRVCEQRIVSLS